MVSLKRSTWPFGSGTDAVIIKCLTLSSLHIVRKKMLANCVSLWMKRYVRMSEDMTHWSKMVSKKSLERLSIYMAVVFDVSTARVSMEQRSKIPYMN